MANSALAETVIPAHYYNYYGKRDRKISQIIIHHMAAKWTAKRCAESFQNPKRGASSNYCIGYNGEIVVSVDEELASGCSSNRAADMSGVTIETANDEIGGDYHVSDKALNSLVNLCADIANRNNLGKLIVGKNVRVHSEFAATACPGKYLKSKLQYICDKANEINEAAVRKKANNGVVYWYKSSRAGYYTIKNNVSMWNNYLTANRTKIVDIPKGAKAQSWGYYNISAEKYIFNWVKVTINNKSYYGYVANSYMTKI